MKRIISILLVAVMIGAMATGCGQKEVEYDSIGTLNNQEIPYDLANFAAKYQQAIYEKKYGDDSSNMWVNDDGTASAMEVTVKAAALNKLENMLLCEEHADDYEVTMTDLEKDKIKVAVKEMMNDNDEEELELLGASEAVVTRYLTLSTIYSNVKEQIMAGVDTDITDEEVMQSTATYLYVPTVSTTNGIVEDMTDSEKKDLFKQLAKDLEDFSGDLSTDMPSKGYEVETISYGKDLSEVVTLDPTFLLELPKLVEGERSSIITGGDGYYVVQLDKAYDQVATAKKKSDLLVSRANTLFTDQLGIWTSEANYVQNDEAWASISFEHSIYAK